MGDTALEATAAVKDALGRLDKAVERIETMKVEAPAAANESGNQNVTQFAVNAGGIGVWAAVTACLMMLVLNVALAMLYLDLSRKYDRMQDHLSAIYMIAPSLKPKE